MVQLSNNLSVGGFPRQVLPKKPPKLFVFEQKRPSPEFLCLSHRVLVEPKNQELSMALLKYTTNRIEETFYKTHNFFHDLSDVCISLGIVVAGLSLLISSPVVLLGASVLFLGLGSRSVLPQMVIEYQLTKEFGSAFEKLGRENTFLLAQKLADAAWLCFEQRPNAHARFLTSLRFLGQNAGEGSSIGFFWRNFIRKYRAEPILLVQKKEQMLLHNSFVPQAVDISSLPNTPPASFAAVSSTLEYAAQDRPFSIISSPTMEYGSQFVAVGEVLASAMYGALFLQKNLAAFQAKLSWFCEGLKIPAGDSVEATLRGFIFALFCGHRNEGRLFKSLIGRFQKLQQLELPKQQSQINN